MTHPMTDAQAHRQADSASMSQAPTDFDGRRIEPQEISPGDTLVIERAAYSSHSDEWSFTCFAFEVTTEIAGGWEATAVAHEAADADAPPAGRAGDDQIRMSLVGEDHLAVFAHDGSSTFKGTCEWRHWRTADADHIFVV